MASPATKKAADEVVARLRLLAPDAPDDAIRNAAADVMLIIKDGLLAKIDEDFG